MILGRDQQPHTPFIPVISPPGDWEHSNVVPLFGETEEETLIRKRDELFAATAKAEAARAKRDILIFGLAGVAIASIATGGVMALAFRSYRRSGSVVGPAIYVGLGSAAVGTAAVLLASRAAGGDKVDRRVAALAIGTSAA